MKTVRRGTDRTSEGEISVRHAIGLRGPTLKALHRVARGKSRAIGTPPRVRSTPEELNPEEVQQHTTRSRADPVSLYNPFRVESGGDRGPRVAGRGTGSYPGLLSLAPSGLNPTGCEDPGRCAGCCGASLLGRTPALRSKQKRARTYIVNHNACGINGLRFPVHVTASSPASSLRPSAGRLRLRY